MSAEAAGSARELAIRRQNDQILGKERAAVGESGGGFTGTNVGGAGAKRHQPRTQRAQ
jgi:hypothetical protein